MATDTNATRVLLVDDSVDEREMYAEFFRARGFCTLQAENADDGFRLAHELMPSVVITDLRLRGVSDGLGLTQRLKQDAGTRHAPVIVLSGQVYETDVEAAQRAGCDRFLPKPCLPSTLAAAVDELLAARPGEM
jgi:two-component system cell cycle response regulator DivK